MTFSKTLTFILFTATIFVASAQENKSREDFLTNVEKVLTQLENFPFYPYSALNITNRKIQITGENQATKIHFKHKIKVSKKNLKKEKIKIYENKLGETLLTYEIIKLNGEIFYVSHTEYVIQNGKSTRLFEELYYDNKYYIKIPYEEN